MGRPALREDHARRAPLPAATTCRDPRLDARAGRRRMASRRRAPSTTRSASPDDRARRRRHPGRPLPPAWRELLKSAVAHGLDVENGLHEYLATTRSSPSSPRGTASSCATSQAARRPERARPARTSRFPAHDRAHCRLRLRDREDDRAPSSTSRPRIAIRPWPLYFSPMPPYPPVYLDHAATTPVRPEVLEAMLPYLAARPSAIRRAPTASAARPARGSSRPGGKSRRRWARSRTR